jgi:choline/ethanolamine kinase
MQANPEYKDIEAIKSSIESWKDLGSDQIKCERLTGLSNKIWKVTALRSSVSPQAVIFRKFGSSGLVDRKRENYILKGLAANHVAAKFYAGTDKYRIEKFCENTHLTPTELLQHPNKNYMAKVIGELHRLEFPELDKTPEFLKVLNERQVINKAKEKAKQQDLFTPEEKEMVDKVMKLTSRQEITFLRSILPKKAGSVVFSHNDLHSENVLCLKKDKRLMLIDYEYSSYNYRGYDIANFFNESMFEYLNADHPIFVINEEKFPEKEELISFIKYYLFFYRFQMTRGIELDAIMNDEDKLMHYIAKKGDLDSFLKEVDEVYEEVKACFLFSHYYWILWSIVQSQNPDIKFDYITYAYERYEFYLRLKRKFFSEE